MNITQEPPSVTWDGSNIVPIQMLLGHLRIHGEPPYRVPDGDFTQLQVWEGQFDADGGWVTVTPGTMITVEDDVITIMFGELSMIGPVNPIEARKGTFIVSFPIDQFTQLEGYMVHVEMAAEHNGIRGTFVYTRIAMWSKKSKNDTWQVFLMPEGWVWDGETVS